MPCEICLKFPVPSSNYEEVAIHQSRHGTLYRCRECGQYMEMIAEERSVRYLTKDEKEGFYSR